VERKTEFGILASTVDMSEIPVHAKPQQIRDELVTMNQYGYMKFEWDEFGKDFANITKLADKPVLEIGPAYGWVTHRILEMNKKIIALDVSKEHLEVLLREAPQDKLDKLFIYHASFPEDVDFPKNSLSAVLASRVFHFFTGETIKRGLDKIYDWLEPNGKFVCTNLSIYHYSVKNQWLAIFKDRERQGVQWAGEIKNQRKSSPIHAPYVQDYLNVFDIKQWEDLLPEHGFKIEKIKLFDYPSDIYSENREGHIGFVARKVAKTSRKNNEEREDKMT
jgi:2-polyprenyl-3-methyl-5-hydroxy-6-metoxy-1,4-benzoquinol methylase